MPPPGTALYFREYFSCVGPEVWHRAITTDGGKLVWDDPLNALPPGSESAGWDQGLIGVSAGGQTLVAWVCERGHCGTFDRPRTEYDVESLWGSDDGGLTWDRWGEYPEGVRVSLVTSDDAAVYSSRSEEPDRVWWFRSGEELARPEDPRAVSIFGWRRADGGPDPVWSDGKSSTLLSTSGLNLAVPRGLEIAATLPDGSILLSDIDYRRVWESQEPGQRDLFYALDGRGSVLGAYSWDGPNSLVVVDHLQGQLFGAFLGTYSCGSSTQAVLVDVGARTVHTIPGLDEIGGFVLFAVRGTPN